VIFGWEPIPWKLGFLGSRRLKQGFLERSTLPLDWRAATESDWPPVEALGDDFDWARRTGTGFVAERDEENLFLIHRDWFGWPDPPEWGLASRSKADGSWYLWGSFDAVPENWKVPEVAHAQNH